MEIRLEKIERDGFSGVHPNLESTISINKLEKELASSIDDVMQLSSVLGKNCCLVFFNETGVVNKDISNASNITSAIILEAFYDENFFKHAVATVHHWTI